MLGQLLVRCGSVTAGELEQALQAQAQAPAGAPRPIGAIMLDQGSVAPAVLAAALGQQQRNQGAKAQESGSVRVDASKLDRLINLVGELIIAGARTDMVARQLGSAPLKECTSLLAGLVEDVRDSALQLRMVKIGATFNRFKRVVHDVSREIGKDIALLVAGEDTELDKTVVEKIGDPLTHLVRNAIDHGIEDAAERLARGKSATGTVKLNAYHESGYIVIEVSDDGGGLKRDKILAKAIERGLVEAGRELSEHDIYKLIFEPGFSTAEQVSNLSGRGVGMDVVKRNITDMHGSVDIHSVEGQGTQVTVRLPLTLAIIDGFLIGVGASVFVLPLDTIEECIAYSTAASGQGYVDVRGQILPLIDVCALFDVEPRAVRRRSIVVVRHGAQRAGLVVDTLLGEFKTVIKPLAKVFDRVDCVSGSTILGNGEVGLILDVPAVLETMKRQAALALAA